eukprot:jgi/Tetstr1/429308/TSEL_019226.t1
MGQHAELTHPLVGLAELVTSWIKPQTAAKQCRFVETGSAPIRVRRCFLSHTWGRPFCEMVTRLRHQVEPSVYVWVDLFPFNQHTAEEERSDLEQHVDTMYDMPMAAVVVDPDGVTFMRAWCLYETHMAAMANHAVAHSVSTGKAPEAHHLRHSFAAEE